MPPPVVASQAHESPTYTCFHESQAHSRDRKHTVSVESNSIDVISILFNASVFIVAVLWLHVSFLALKEAAGARVGLLDTCSPLQLGRTLSATMKPD